MSGNGAGVTPASAPGPAAAAAGPPAAALDEAARRELEAFVFLEARLADESRYEEWEALVTDDVHYWVPNGRADYDPATRLSYVNDNRARLATRLRQLRTGVRHAQTPPSPLRRTVANLEVLVHDLRSGEALVAANQVVYEVAAQSTGELRLWPGRVTYRLRRVEGRWRLAGKTIELLQAGGALPNLTFLL
jgi:3-phenylpropionate/cinnamic acid dioxygenase small subunit